jgi:hypothetical protein
VRPVPSDRRDCRAPRIGDPALEQDTCWVTFRGWRRFYFTIRIPPRYACGHLFGASSRRRSDSGNPSGKPPGPVATGGSAVCGGRTAGVRSHSRKDSAASAGGRSPRVSSGQLAGTAVGRSRSQRRRRCRKRRRGPAPALVARHTLQRVRLSLDTARSVLIMASAEQPASHAGSGSGLIQGPGSSCAIPRSSRDALTTP